MLRELSMTGEDEGGWEDGSWMMEVLIRVQGSEFNVLDRKGLKGSRKKKQEKRIKMNGGGRWKLDDGS